MTTLRQNRIFPLIFRCLSIGLTIAGILSTAIYDGAFHASSFLFYTIQSNLLVLFLFILLVYRTIYDLVKMGKKGMSSYYETFEFVCLLDILVTFFIFWLALAKDMALKDLFTFSNLTVHGVVPILVVIDYYLFTLPKSLQFKNIFLTWLFPLSYVVFASVVGATGYVYQYQDNIPIHYPYFFLDYDKNGPLVALYVGVLILIFTVLGTLMFYLDRYRLKRHQKPWKKDV